MDDDVLAPIDYLAIEFPGGHVTGDAFQSLMDVSRRGVIRVLDLEFIVKSDKGAVRKTELDAIEHDADVDVAAWQAQSRDCSTNRTSRSSPPTWRREASPASWCTKTSGQCHSSRPSTRAALASSVRAGSPAMMC